MKITMNEDYQFVSPPEDEQTDTARFTPGAHKHGYYITLTDKEQGVLLFNNYKLVTNGCYSRGDFYEILAPNGSVVDPIELGKILERFGV